MTLATSVPAAIPHPVILEFGRPQLAGCMPANIAANLCGAYYLIPFYHVGKKEARVGDYPNAGKGKGPQGQNKYKVTQVSEN